MVNLSEAWCVHLQTLQGFVRTERDNAGELLSTVGAQQAGAIPITVILCVSTWCSPHAE